MKNLLLLLLSVFFLCQCADKSATAEGKTIRKTKLDLKTCAQADYDALIAKEKKRSPIARLCAESKGYRKDEWDALNECSWAVEKHQMNLHPEMVQRKGGQLFLSFADSTHLLTHQADEYYQFVDYLPSSKHFIIRILRPLACPMYWLLNTATNEKTVLSGEPIFTGDKKSFLLSMSSESDKISCPETISYWSLVNGQFQEHGFLKHDKGVSELLWKEGNSWIGKEGSALVEVSY
ncbi:MAG: hypothetical protein AB8F74_14335 [Saprospiraceae bacterium]